MKIKIIGVEGVETSIELEKLLVRMIKEIDSGLCRFDWMVVGRRVDRFVAQRSLWRESFS